MRHASADRIAVILALVCVALGVVGQLCMKHGMAAVGAVEFGTGAPLTILGRVARSISVWSGLAAYGLSAMLWLVVLSRLPLSQAYPIIALGYVAIVLISRVAFNEPLSLAKLGGVLLIVAGVWLVHRPA